VIDEAILRQAGVSADARPATIVLIEGGRAYARSTAALRIARRLRFPWNALAAGLIVPRPIRDAVYDWVARHRYGWFGRTDVCELPPPEWRDRFLDAGWCAGAEAPAHEACEDGNPGKPKIP
jgi:predicted DCC family thiol-disulfide oxidoreductase YuxK